MGVEGDVFVRFLGGDLELFCAVRDPVGEHHADGAVEVDLALVVAKHLHVDRVAQGVEFFR